MKDRAVARGAIIEVGLALDERDQPRHVLRRRFGTDHDHHRHDGGKTDRGKACRVVLQRRIDRRHDRHGRYRAHQQGVTVGRGLRQQLAGQAAARAGLVVDDEGLAERLAHFRCHDARDDVGHTARRERDHHAQRLGFWPFRLSRCRRGKHGQRRRECGASRYVHLFPPGSCCQCFLASDCSLSLVSVIREVIASGSVLM